MNIADWIAVAAVSLPVGGVGVKLVMGMTRLIDAVEQLADSVDRIADRVEDHEKRLARANL